MTKCRSEEDLKIDRATADDTLEDADFESAVVSAVSGHLNRTEETVDKIKIAMIGAGGMANNVHYPSLNDFEDVEIAAISDLNAEKLNATADKYGVEGRYADYRKMIEEVEPDGVYVIMPPHHLFDIVLHCLKQGQNVFIEKPPGVMTYQTASMAEAAEKNGCLTMVAFNRRYIPLMQQVRKIVEERGPIIQCTSTFMKNHGGARYYDGAIDVLACDAVHAVDTLRWMGGEVKALASDVNSYYMPFENCFNALVHFESGATGFLVTNWAVGKRIHTFEMHAHGVSALLNPNDRAVIYADNSEEGQVITTQEAAGSDQNYRFYGFYDENRHFIDCLKEKRPPETNFADAVKTMELVDRIYASRIC